MMNSFKDIEKNVCEFTGADEVAVGLSEYYRELDSLDIKYRHDKPKKIWKWLQKNRFFVFVHKDTKQVIGFRVTAEATIRPWRFLFATSYVPVACMPDIIPPQASAQEITVAAIAVLERFMNEVKGMYVVNAMPLFLLHHAGNDDYLAWSMQENRYVGVYNYKSYRHVFGVSELPANPSPTSSEGRYVIIPPSDELIRGLGLSLDSSAYRKKS